MDTEVRKKSRLVQYAVTVYCMNEKNYIVGKDGLPLLEFIVCDNVTTAIRTFEQKVTEYCMGKSLIECMKFYTRAEDNISRDMFLYSENHAGPVLCRLSIKRVTKNEN